MLLMSIPSYANFMRNGILYLVTSAEEKTVGVAPSRNHSYSGDITIPSTVTYNGDTYSVTSIGDGAFDHCPSLTSVIIPNSVISIGTEAFAFCYGLTSVTIPESVTSIGDGVFECCYGLTSVTIPESVTSIGSNAFFGCRGLISVTIPNSVTSIGSYAFLGCSGLTSVTIPNNVTSIGNGAFSACRGLTSVTIPDSVTSIGNGAFSACSGLTSIKVASGNSKYDSRNNCNAIIEIATNTLIAGCQNTVIPNSVTSIANSAFGGCSSLISLTIPNSVTSIGASAFSGCSGLTSITIPNSVTSIGQCAFKDCSGLTSFTIPNSVTTIEEETFRNCSSLTSFTIPNSVTSIGNSAFSGCSGLTSVTIPESVTSIGNSSFSGCSGLTSVTIPNSVTSLGAGAFSWCYSLTDVYCYAKNVPNTSTNAFEASYIENATLLVLGTSVNTYSTTEPWKHFGTIKALEDDIPFANNKLYTLTCKRGAMVLNADATGLAAGQKRTDATAAEKRFAFITYEGRAYLYSPVNKQFLSYDGRFVSRLGSPITFDDTHADGNYMYMLMTKNNAGETIYFNNNKKTIVINDYETPDDGNRWLIKSVADFDPTEALTLASTQLYTVTYEVRFEGNVVATATEEVASGSALPPVPTSLYNDFVTLTKYGTHPTKITKDVTVRYTATWNGPFEFTKTLDNAIWYKMHIRSGWYVGKQNTEPYYPTQNPGDALKTKEYQWAFGGDPYHVKLYNRSTGLDETLTKVGEIAVMRPGDYTWDLLPNSDGFVLRVTGTENTCINQVGGGGGPLKFWTDNNSPTNNGSTFRVEGAVAINDGMTSLNIETELNGNLVVFTHDFNGKWESLYLPFAINYDDIKADFDLAEIDGVVQNDENNDGTPDITVLSIIGFKGQTTTPNKPYLIRAKNAGEQTIVFDDVTVYPTEEVTFDCASFSTRYDFTGSYNTLNASALANRYVVQGGELVKGASTLAPCRWYMTATARNGAPLNLPNKIRIMPVEDVITGVEAIDHSTLTIDHYYNLAGQRIPASRHGLNIIRFSDGTSKKVLVK